MLIAVFTPLPVALLILVVYGLNTYTGMVVFNSTVQGAVPDAVRWRVFTLLDVTWNAMRLSSLAIDGIVVDAWGLAPLLAGREHAGGGRYHGPGAARPARFPRERGEGGVVVKSMKGSPPASR